MKAGADDFVTKPYDPDRLRLLVKRILERRELIDELEQLRKQMRGDYHFHNMVSKSPKIRKVFDLIEQVGPIGSTVLIHGETGTGKELVAQALHAADTRRAGPFIALNCAVLNDSLLESELFGHEKGAFTGAERRKIGRFELADGGTLLLDEIGESRPACRPSCCESCRPAASSESAAPRASRSTSGSSPPRTGGWKTRSRKGRFRADLFYRLNVIRIELPPLRERTEDIPLLATHFLREAPLAARDAASPRSPPTRCRRCCGTTGRETSASWKMRSRRPSPWPTGPSCAATTCRNRSHHGPLTAQRAGSLLDIERPLPDLTCDLIGRVEREYFVRVLSQYKGNVARCARHSGLSRRSVTQKLQKYGLERTAFKGRCPRKGDRSG